MKNPFWKTSLGLKLLDMLEEMFETSKKNENTYKICFFTKCLYK